MRWYVPTLLVAIACLAAAATFVPGGSSADSATETHCAVELTAGDGSAAGPVTCFETEEQLNQAAGIAHPADEPSSVAPE